MEVNVEEFFEGEFPNFAIYNLYRMVGSYVDGLKPSSRKVVHTAARHKITAPIKVSRLGAKVSEETEYLHGEDNLQGVIIGMAQNFPGTNNLEILHPESSFGNRCFPQAAAARYIFTRKSSYFDSLFNPVDAKLLPEQEFEGSIIEPRYFMPTLPLILVNGSEGIGSGWSQKILPRNVGTIKKAIKRYLKDGKLPDRLRPSYRGFKGSIEHVRDNVWEVCGNIEIKNTTTIMITELPIGITLDRYTDILSKLEDNQTIVSYTDFSDPGENSFLFEIKCLRSWSNKKTERDILEALKLTRHITENYTCMDERNEVREFSNEIEILKAYIDLRMTYYKRRKTLMLAELEEKKKVAEAKYKFVTSIVNGKLEIYRKTKNQIESKLHAYHKVDGKWNYLLNMPIYSFSKETLNELHIRVKEIQDEFNVISVHDLDDMWIQDLEKIG